VQLPHVQCLEDFASPACEVWPSPGYGRIFTTALEGLASVCKATALELEELELELEDLASPPACELWPWPGPSGYGKIDSAAVGCTTGFATVPNDGTRCGACASWPIDDVTLS